MSTVIVRSYDMDHCILVPHMPSEKTISYHTTHFASAALETADKQYIFLGSTRQTPGHDDSIARWSNTPQGSDMVRKIAEHLGAIHNTLFAGDVATYTVKRPTPVLCKMPPGHMYQNEKNVADPTANEVKLAYVDCEKIFLIYEQLSNMCVHEPDAEKIIFNFYDDHDERILKQIKEFFEAHPQLLYKNVELNLWHYFPNDGMVVPRKYATIRGTCEKPHLAYYDVLAELANNDGFKYQKHLESNDLAFYVNKQRFTDDFVQNLVRIGTENKASHEPGEGLIDYGAKSVAIPCTTLRDTRQTGDKQKERHDSSVQKPAALRR